jgi:hypothetical protein
VLSKEQRRGSACDPEEFGATTARFRHVLRDVTLRGCVISFRLGQLPQAVTIELRKERTAHVWWTQSHIIQTPRQRAPARPTLCMGASFEEAFRLPVEDLVWHYTDAVSAGFEPESGWLLPWSAPRSSR